jgi:hypothetical protein
MRLAGALAAVGNRPLRYAHSYQVGPLAEGWTDPHFGRTAGPSRHSSVAR